MSGPTRCLPGHLQTPQFAWKGRPGNGAFRVQHYHSLLDIQVLKKIVRRKSWWSPWIYLHSASLWERAGWITRCCNPDNAQHRFSGEWMPETAFDPVLPVLLICWLQPPWPSTQCTSLGQQVLWTLLFCWFSPGRLSVPGPDQEWGRAQQDARGAGWPRVLLAAAPAPVGSTVPAGGHRAEVTRWGTRAASHCSWGPVALAGHTHSPGVPHCPPPLGLPHHSPGLLSAHHWHAARPTGDRTMQHWNEYNSSFNWG